MTKIIAILLIVFIIFSFIPVLTCPKCNGSGHAVTQLFIGCSKCNNTGKVSLINLLFGKVKNKDLKLKLPTK